MKLSRRQREDPGTLAPYKKGQASPFHELNRIRNEIFRIFEDPFAPFSPATSFFEGWEPNIDIYEDSDKISVKAELPGMKKEDIDISLTGNTLTVAGERKSEEEHKEGEQYRSERYFGRFQRSITLPQAVDAKKIQAAYKDGVLTVTLPKTEEAKSRKIEIQP